MSRLAPVIVFLVFGANPALSFSQQPPVPQPSQVREAVIQQTTLRGTVESIDHIARTVRIRGQQGNVVTLDVPASVTRFDSVKTGDVVSISYYDRVNVRMKPVGEPDVDRREGPTLTAVPGLLPNDAKVSQRITTVTIDAWDAATRMMTFRTPSGQSYTRRINETIDASLLAGLKVGDRVDVTRSEAVNLQVEAMAAQAPQPLPPVTETFRDRFTISFLIGPDPQVGGDVLHEDAGFINGVTPISFRDTSYGDVYGTPALLKLGFGYRMSPRSEANFHFVFSQNGGEPVQVGTIGTENAPLTADIDDYWYWGFEGGQRFYFARVRFTPFLGYTLGLNHYKQIDGHFTAPAVNTQPALDVADGTIYDASWAFTFGPTTGMLVGVGPVEVQAEIAWRYSGGPSGVDFIADDNLTEINSDNGRWSMPVLFGARVRF